MVSRAVDSSRWQAYLLARQEGLSKKKAADKAGISYSSVMRVERDVSYSPEYQRAKRVFDDLHPKEPVANRANLSPEAARALDDFAYFRLRYFGIYSTPWQLDAAERIVQLLATDEKEYVVINCPPGSGKSTLFTHDIPCWLIARNRAVRIMIGSASERVAKMYGGRIMRTLERPDPVKNKAELVERGVMADAQATMVADFGRFKPGNRDLWRKEEFVVEKP